MAKANLMVSTLAGVLLASAGNAVLAQDKIGAGEGRVDIVAWAPSAGEADDLLARALTMFTAQAAEKGCGVQGLDES